MKTLIILLALSLPVVAQHCATPQTSNLPNGAISISYNCSTVSPGQNSPFSISEQVGVPAIDRRAVFSSISLSYQGGYYLYGNAVSMSTVFTFPDIHAGNVAAVFDVSGVGPYFQQSPTGIWRLDSPMVDDFFSVRQDVSLTSNIAANCYAYCGYSVVITLNP